MPLVESEMERIKNNSDLQHLIRVTTFPDILSE